MKIAILTDQSRASFLPSEEAMQEDNQKLETVKELKNILSKKYDCISLTADDNIISALRNENVDLVFNLCNGLNGDSKLSQIPAMLEFAGIPYTASSVIGHTLASNKFYSSKLFKSNNVYTPDFIAINKISELENIDLNFPILIKPNDEGSSRGIHQDSLVNTEEELFNGVKKALELYQPPILLNEYIVGREFSVGIIGNGNNIEVLPIQEVDLSNLPGDLEKFYSFEVKTYYKEYTTYHIPAKLSKEEELLIKRTCIKAYNTLNLKDYARVDVILKDDIPYVLEINSLPGLMKNKSALYRMAESSGQGYENFVLQIVETAKDRYNL